MEAILREYVSLSHGWKNVDNLIPRILNEYNLTYDRDKSSDESISQINNGNMLLEVFNDAKVVAPIILTAIIHSRANPGHTFLYRFDYANGHYGKVSKCRCPLTYFSEDELTLTRNKITVVKAAPDQTSHEEEFPQGRVTTIMFSYYQSPSEVRGLR